MQCCVSISCSNLLWSWRWPLRPSVYRHGLTDFKDIYDILRWLCSVTMWSLGATLEKVLRYSSIFSGQSGSWNCYFFVCWRREQYGEWVDASAPWLPLTNSYKFARCAGSASATCWYCLFFRLFTYHLLVFLLLSWLDSSGGASALKLGAPFSGLWNLRRWLSEHQRCSTRECGGFDAQTAHCRCFLWVWGFPM